MPCYLYLCADKHGEFEEYHSINHKLEECPKCKEEGKISPVVRLINSENGFILAGGGWAREGYK